MITRAEHRLIGDYLDAMPRKVQRQTPQSGQEERRERWTMTWLGARQMSRSMLGRGLVAAGLCGAVALCAALAGCAHHGPEPQPLAIPDTRVPLGLTAQESREHRAVMLQHLETVQAIVAALAEEDFVRAQGLTEAHLGFFMHRQMMAGQHPESFPPAYHDLAMAHHEAAESLAKTMPSRDLKQILPKLDGVLKACVACHLSFKVPEKG